MGKPSTKIDGAALLQESKDNAKKLKQQKENKMKTPNQTAKTVITVLITIATLAAIAGLLYVGFNFGRTYEQGLNHEITSQAKELVTVISTKK